MIFSEWTNDNSGNFHRVFKNDILWAHFTVTKTLFRRFLIVTVLRSPEKKAQLPGFVPDVALRHSRGLFWKAHTPFEPADKEWDEVTDVFFESVGFFLWDRPKNYAKALMKADSLIQEFFSRMAADENKNWPNPSEIRNPSKVRKR